MTKLKASISSTLPEGLLLGDDGQPRCSWALRVAGFVNYHDKEWGFPVEDEYRLFEKICLEGFQSGLSWKTVLDKRPAFRSQHSQLSQDIKCNTQPKAAIQC